MDGTEKHYRDLSHVFEEDIPTFPGLPKPAITAFMTHEGSGERYDHQCSFEISFAAFATSTGTYLDAPRHRYPGARDIADIPITELIVPGAALDFSLKKRKEPIVAKEIEGALYAGDLEGLALLIHTGWDRFWKSEEYASAPFLDESAAALLARRKIRLLGIDAPNVDNPSDLRRPVHSILLKAGCLIVENLTGLAELCGRRFEFGALPIRARGAASFPVRAFARL